MVEHHLAYGKQEKIMVVSEEMHRTIHRVSDIHCGNRVFPTGPFCPICDKVLEKDRTIEGKFICVSCGDRYDEMGDDRAIYKWICPTCGNLIAEGTWAFSPHTGWIRKRNYVFKKNPKRRNGCPTCGSISFSGVATSKPNEFYCYDCGTVFGKTEKGTHIVSLNTGRTLKNKERSIPMVDATDYFGGNYLKASDIKEPTALTITKVKEQQLEDRKKLIVSFDETDKGLVLNKINTNRIIKWAGSKETDNWAGTKITLLATTVEYDGKDVPCIRVKKKPEDEEA